MIRRWRGRGLPRLQVGPWDAANPYQEMLYAAFEGAVDLRRLGYGDLLKGLPPSRAAVIHFHWDDGVFWGVTDPPEIARREARVQSVIARHKRRGGKLVWTLHNDPILGGQPQAEAFRRLRSLMIAEADLIHVHSQAAEAVLTAGWGADPGKICRIAHPSYQGVYPEPDTPPAIKPPGKARFVVFGRLRPYKGIERLFDVFARADVAAVTEGLRFHGTGDAPIVAAVSRFAAAAPVPVQFVNERVSEAQVVHSLRQGHFALMPYRRGLTSGAAMLAQGAGVPIVVGRVGGMAETVPPEGQALLFDADDDADLARAILTAARMPPDAHAALIARCLDWGREHAPRHQSERLLEAYRRRGIL